MATDNPPGDAPILTTSTDPGAFNHMLHDLDVQAASEPDVVEKARESLEETLQTLRLTPEEEHALAGELRQLRALTEKLDQNTVEIAAFGMVSRGKSSVLNALLGQEVFKVGTTHGTTVQRSQQRWEQAALDRPGLEGSKLVLVDTPGIDEVGGEVRETLARDVARHADLILFVVSSDMQRVEVGALARLRDAQKPIILVFNQIDRYPDTDRDQILAKIKDERVRNLIQPADVVMTAARPDPHRVKIQLPNGTTTIQWERPLPVIEPLKLRILDVLEREGKALVALNTLLLAGDLHEEIVAHKIRIRDDAANRTIWNFSLAKGAAVALNPIPVADMAGGLAVDVGMILTLSKVYGIPLTRRTASGLVKDMMVALGTLGAVEVVVRLVASGVKSSLAGLTVLSGGLAAPLTALGYGAIGLAQGGTAATTSYVLGHGAKVYLQQGCQWGPRGIKTVVQKILAEAKADSVIDRLRDDLKRRVLG
jgi:small GTP-binding protein